MSHKQQQKLADHVRLLWMNDSRLDVLADDRIAAGILSSPQAHVDALVAAGVLKQHMDYGVPPGNCYSVVTPKRMVRAGYRKLEPGEYHADMAWEWTATCSEHGDINHGRDPEVVGTTKHFETSHSDDHVEWDDPPHEHRLVWSGDPSGRPCVVCADGDLTAFYPYEVGSPYSGPIPESLQ